MVAKLRNSSAAPTYYTYIFRRWLHSTDLSEPDAQAEVIVISSAYALTPDLLLTRVEEHTPKAKEFVMVEVDPGSSARLDTWQRPIEPITPVYDALAIRVYRNWWNASEVVRAGGDDEELINQD